MSSVPAVGDPAPDFTLPGTAPGKPDHAYSLASERGHPVVLAFYPGDETPVCTKQLCSYQNDLDVLNGLGVDVALWGISSQGVESHRRFQTNRGLSFPLLADENNEVFRAYGLGSLLNRRAVFVIGADGRIAWRHVSTTGLNFQKLDRIAEAVRSIAPATYPNGGDTGGERPAVIDLTSTEAVDRLRNGGLH
jgi:peroxiredoxin Q/BCP